MIDKHSVAGSSTCGIVSISLACPSSTGPGPDVDARLWLLDEALAYDLVIAGLVLWKVTSLCCTRISYKNSANRRPGHG